MSSRSSPRPTGRRPAAIDFEASLNLEQLAAVTHGDGPQLVIAGAGSGKTRVITYRIAWLVQERGVEAGHIAAVTFTNKAAEEMRERVEAILGVHPVPSFVGTFHRFALRLLRRYAPKVGLPRDFSILDTSDQLTILKRAMKAAGVPEDSFRPRAVLSAIGHAKNKLLGPQQYSREAEDFFARKTASVYEHYQATLREAGAVDFDDMIRLSVELLRSQDGIRRWVRERFRHLLVDEFQDTNHAQLELIRQLVGARGQLTAVGDEDQGIYRWRGAELTHILGFERTFEGATVRKLERNYRSTQRILDASGAVVARNEQRRGKSLWTEAGDGERLLLYRGRDEQDEGRWIANALSSLEGEHGYRRMAVLVRTNAQTRAIEEAFLRRGVPYSLVAGVRFYERAEIKDLVAYLRLARSPGDVLAFDRVLNRPPRGIGKTTRQKLERAAESERKGLWELLVDDKALERLFAARALAALRRFRDLVEELGREAEVLPLPALLRHILDATGFREQFDPDDADDKARLENIEELLSAAQEFTEKNTYGQDEDVLSAFLDQSALAADTDRLGGPGVSLMTLHSAKGLEFRVVVVAGLEEGLLPHFNARSHPDDLEEERRLFYVGMTRAQERLLLTTCRRRRVAGNWQDQDESRFLEEIPADLMEVETSPELFASPGGFGSSRGGFSRGGSAGTGWGGASSSTGPTGGGSRSAQDVMSFFGRASEAADAAPVSENEPPSIQVSHPRLPFEPSPTGGGALKRGSRVRHEKFGVGKILSVDGEGDAAKLLVYFDSVGRRKMIAKYANLTVL